MNEDDLKQGKSKKVKVKNTVNTEVAEVKAEKKTAKKVVAKTEVEPKVKKTAPKTAKTVTAKVEPETNLKVKKTIAKAKTEEIVGAKTETKAKKVTAKTKEPAEVKSETKIRQPRAKTVAEVEKKETEVETVSLPLAAKIQTQENFDLIEKELETAELSPVFKELADPKLPALREENRAFLQIQSPTRVFFYWSLKQDSSNTLRRALGIRADDYFLAIRLTNLGTNKEEIHEVGNKGSWWFNNIEADSKYRAEVGFYSQGRPFVRIVFSNTLETPRLKPSENVAYQPYFAVTADQFAEVLDLAGFSQDAFEVSLKGDEPQGDEQQIADEATQKAFVQLTGKGQVDFSSIDISELRYVLFALGSGVSLYSLRSQVAENLFEFLSALTQENPEALTEEKVILALEEFFGVSPFEEKIEEEFISSTVFGASLINFPKQLKKKPAKYDPQGKLNPLSSFSLK